ncbi:MAG: trigger factor, partial [Chloroflexi bacterium]|nr:trigger factor [Chloroflexota bacterium]
MNIKTEQTNDAKAIVTVEVDEERVQGAMRLAAQHVSRARPLAGFRPGKAPYEIVERTFGKDYLREHAIDDLAQEIYKQILRDEKIPAYAAGQLEIAQPEPLILRYTIPTRPVVMLGDYRAIHLQPQPIAVTEDEVTKTIDQIRREHATLAPVERAVQSGDVLTVNLKGGFQDKDPVDSQGLVVTVDKESSTFPWVDQLIGAMLNETRNVAYTYPADDLPDLAGKTASYAVTITEHKEQQLPPLDDDLAKLVGKFETLAQLMTQLRADLREQKKNEEENRFADQVIDAIIAQSQIVFPEIMLNDQIDQEISREQRFATQLGMAWDKYLEMTGKSGAKLREEMKPRAENKIKRLLTVLELVKAENIEVTREEVLAEIDRQVAYAVANGAKEPQARKQLNNAATRRDLELNLKMRLAVDRVTARAKGEP